jgi:hypothetical protein
VAGPDQSDAADRYDHIRRHSRFAAIGIGIRPRAAMLKPLAIAIISGLIFQLPLVLVLPALLALFRSHRADEDWQK